MDVYSELHPLDIKWFFYSVLTVSQPQNKTWGWGPLCEAANRMEVRRSELWNWKGQGSHFPLITVPRCPLEARCEWRDLCPVLCRSWWLNLAKDSSLHCPLTVRLSEETETEQTDDWMYSQLALKTWCNLDFIMYNMHLLQSARCKEWI